VSHLLRGIKLGRWRRPPEGEWLEAGEIPADPVADFRTIENRFSVYMLLDEGPSLDRVVAAIASGREKVENFDYIVFEEDLLAEIGIRTEISAGATRDQEVNACHLDLVELTGKKVLCLAQAVYESREPDRKHHFEVTAALVESVQEGKITLEGLPEKIRRSIESVLAHNR